MSAFGFFLKVVLELVALAAGPVGLVLAYTDSYRGSTGAVLVLVSIGAGILLWAVVTLALEGNLRRSVLVQLMRRRRGPPAAFVESADLPRGRRIARRVWVMVALVLFVGGCALSLNPPKPTEQFSFADTIPLGSVVDVEQPALIGRLIPGSPRRIGAAQFSGNGRSLYVRFAGGVCDALWSATASQPTDDQVLVDLRVGTRLCLGAVPAVAVFYAARMDLANPINPANPPRVVDASTGESVPIAVPPG